MTYFDRIAELGQTDIFDFINITNEIKVRKEIKLYDAATIGFYCDEIDYIKEHHVELLGLGRVVDIKLDFCRIRIGGTILDIAAEKLEVV